MDANSRIIVLGDSVAWGQGLQPSHKFAYRVAAEYGASTAAADFMQAHSGAIIGASQRDPTTSINPEIPAPSPMIIDQIDPIQSPETVDLLLLMGGINDVNIRTIFDPFTSLAHLSQRTEQVCYRDMKVLLAKACATFTKPTVQIRVIGYYPILSPASNPLAGPAGDPLIHLLGNSNLGFPQTLGRDIVLGALIERAMQFWTDSIRWTLQAVNETANGGTRSITFVPVPFTPGNALFTPDSRLWGFGNGLGPEDEVETQRLAACAIQYPRANHLLENEVCHLASIGHPNVAGAQMIAQAILETL